MPVKTVPCACPRCQRLHLAERNLNLVDKAAVNAQCVDCKDRHDVSVTLLIRKHGEWSCAKCAAGRGKR